MFEAKRLVPASCSRPGYRPVDRGDVGASHLSLSGLMAWMRAHPRLVAMLQLASGLVAIATGLFYVHALHTSGLLLLPENFEEKRGAMRDYRVEASMGGKSATTFQGHFAIGGEGAHYFVAGFSRDRVIDEFARATTVSCTVRRADVFQLDREAKQRCFGFVVDGRVVRSLDRAIADQKFFDSIAQVVCIALAVAGVWLACLGILGLRGVVLE